MSEIETKPKSTSQAAAKMAPRDEARRDSSVAEVMQVEKRDFTALVPTDRPRSQRLRGFEECYTDIVDYIVRSTHRIWDERNPGLIYSHYASNAVVYGSLGTTHNREDVIRATIQRIVEMPDRRGMATQVIWRGDDETGFYTSHLVTSTGRHTEPGPYGLPTGRTFVTRTIADCMVFENRVYREWLVRDNMAVLRQLGVDPGPIAERMAAEQFAKGFTLQEIAENGRLLGQYGPEEEADLTIAHTEGERACLRWMHDVHNRRLYGRIRDVYAPNVIWHGPLMRDLYGVASVLSQTMKLAAMIPDLVFIPQHICSVDSVEGGEKIAVRWVMDGHHLGHGSLGAPTGHRLFVMGMTHLHVIDGKVVEDWTLYDELALLTQLKLGSMG
jgi:predicted ester cyclase